MGRLTGLDMKTSTRSLPFQSEHKTPPIQAHLTGPLDFPADHPMKMHPSNILWGKGEHPRPEDRTVTPI